MIREKRQMQTIQQIPGIRDFAASAFVAVGDSSAHAASWVGWVRGMLAPAARGRNW